MEIEGLAGPQRVTDGATGPFRRDSFGGMMGSDANGFFAEQVARGNGFCFSTALAGVALIATTTTNNQCVLWNPPGNAKFCALQFVKYGRTANGTPLEGSIVYNIAREVRALGTGADLVSGTAVAGSNLRSDLQGDNSGMKWYPAASVFTTAPVLLGTAGIAQTADDGATTVSGPRAEMIRDDIWGSIQIWPGSAFNIGAAVALSTTYTISIYALMLPLPLHA